MTKRGRTVAALLAGWAAMFAAVAFFRPLMPVDETRYMSVAWEMLVRQNWLLPTLNFEPYSHKPPLLFWLISLSWALGGVHVWPARIVSFLLTAGFVYLSGRLAKRLFPEHENIDLHAMLALAAMPVFLVYGSVIMFDVLLGLCVLGAVAIIWRMGETHSLRGFAFLGAVIGIGILAKGPVALVYMLPPALLAPLWRTGTGGRWYAGIVMAVAIGAAVALAWAVPAAIMGGPEYGDKIFIKQSAGRMINAFDHRRPFWYYALVLCAYLAPFLCWPGLWRGAKAAYPAIKTERAVRFLACWIVPVFVFFSVISSKQFHYMTPVLPGFAVLAARALSRADVSGPKSASLPGVLMLLPAGAVIAFGIAGKPLGPVPLGDANMHLAYLHIAAGMGVLWWAGKAAARALPCLALSALLLAGFAHAQLGQAYLPRYDLAPIRDAMAPYRERPIAVAPKYDGEFGYALRLTHHVDGIGREDVDQWLAAHPDGVVIARYKHAAPAHYDILYQQPFRSDEVLVILQRQVMVGSR